MITNTTLKRLCVFASVIIVTSKSVLLPLRNSLPLLLLPLLLLLIFVLLSHQELGCLVIALVIFLRMIICGIATLHLIIIIVVLVLRWDFSGAITHLVPIVIVGEGVFLLVSSSTPCHLSITRLQLHLHHGLCRWLLLLLHLLLLWLRWHALIITSCRILLFHY